MTRDEREKTIKILQWLHDNTFLFRSTEEDVKYATENAIRALEQEASGDSISRQAALELFTWTNTKEDIWYGLKQLPSVSIPHDTEKKKKRIADKE